ncbi:MAG: ATP-binding cassette domain-containing protein [Actinomycetota bacterium]|nr:ATP-binding cassette domain-containing protein [Actinomycetota bacterium]
MELITPPAALQTHEIYRFFHVGDDETFALRGVSLEVRAGEVVALIGPSGSGKSSLIACLAGIDEPDGGFATVGGQRMTRRSEAHKAGLRAHLGVLLQSDNLIAHLTVEENVAAAQRPGLENRSEKRRTALEQVGMTSRAHHTPSQLSGGEAARAGLATALANDPRAIIADEPTGEVDAATESRILEILAARAEAGAAVLVVTHSKRVAAAAHRVLTLTDGRLVDG